MHHGVYNIELKCVNNSIKFWRQKIDAHSYMVHILSSVRPADGRLC